ncbi:putative membrane protein [Candidatus Nitrosomarinus catalina]|uniref:Putative membrane protein n=1 Tax=Candidatus Nitrosomarinus catalinensis TaxID=1898749 RepID=A0A2Z2HL68_9ARCH|nr:calcium/sodium antiporter [Candidatus Nitrosomarinus catalina]ARS64703.1 putative membrane protein [Candidatus Nitrosomarinus catalina]
MEVILSATLLVIGLVMLCFGGNWLVSGGVGIAKKFRISNLVIGMTIVAYGTSTPELAASIAAAGDHGAIILGNIVGSNIANVGMVIGVSAILIPVAIQKSVLRKEIPIMLGVSLLLVLLSIDGELSIYDGGLLLVGLGVFAFFTFRDALKQRTKPSDDSENTKNNIYLKSFGLIAIGIVVLYIGAILTVDNAVIIASEFGLSEKIIGLTVIAIGTSLPELITSIIAIRKGHSDIGIGNIIGSNIYNVLMIMGVGAALGGVLITSDVYVDYAIMIIFSLSLLIGLKTKIINRTMGIILATGYVLYLVTTFFK